MVTRKKRSTTRPAAAPKSRKRGSTRRKTTPGSDPVGIVVTGDFVIDQHVYSGVRLKYADRTRGVEVVEQLGGAAPIRDLLVALVARSEDRPVERAEGVVRAAQEERRRAVREHTLPQKPNRNAAAAAARSLKKADAALAEAEQALEQARREKQHASPAWQVELTVEEPPIDIPASQRAYAFWSPCKAIGSEGKSASEFWRVTERLGFGSLDRGLTLRPRSRVPGTRNRQGWPNRSIQHPNPRVIVISEGGTGYRQDAASHAALPVSHDCWIVLKTSAPWSDGELWRTLTTTHRKRLVVVVSAHELRQSDALLSEGLSWDHTLRDVRRELEPDGALHSLRGCSHLVIAFGSEGCLWVDMEAGRHEPAATLVYESSSIEGNLFHAHEGTSIGFMSCVTAAVSWQLAQQPRSAVQDAGSVFMRAMERALAAMRDLEAKGHGAVDEDPGRGFPATRLARQMDAAPLRFSRATFSLGEPAEDWSLLRDAIGADERADERAGDLGKRIVERGHLALANVPHLNLGDLISADPEEVGALRTLVQQIRRYAEEERPKKPLSIGVFGPPGSGKSFAVKQLAQHVVPHRSWLEFNLSQFDSPSDLIGAFHQIQDKVLQGKLPVAFFDEFDSRQHYWLQYLLAPMQDGLFQDSMQTHSLGKCLFVCAGGTSWTFDTFGPPEARPGDPPPDEGLAQRRRDFHNAKGPDFKSRLDAYLDVLGPNRRYVQVKPGREAEVAGNTSVIRVGDHLFEADERDVFLPVRRALQIRHKLATSESALVDLDAGVLNALLRVENASDRSRSYRHGSRSLEKVLQPFIVVRDRPMKRSTLLPTPQLEMHTDAADFLEKCREVWELPERVELDDSEVERVAVAVHGTWAGLRPDQVDEMEEVYADLDDFYKDSNRAAARRMSGALALVGLELVKGVAEPTDQVLTQIESNLEVLADDEHRGWMDWHFAQGWRYAEERDNTAKKHDCLVPFSELSESDRDKDRASVRMYVAFARAAGYHIGLAQPPQATTRKQAAGKQAAGKQAARKQASR